MEFSYKHIFDFINQFEAPKEGSLEKKSSTLDQIQAQLILNESEFEVRFTIYDIEKRISNNDTYKNVFFLGNTQLKFTDFLINERSLNISTTSPYNEHYSAKVSQIESKNFNSK